MFIGSVFLQLVVSAGLLNVWVLRRSKSTDYRGGDSQTLKQEFETYGLSEGIYYLVGFLKITSAAAILASFWMPFLKLYAASTIALLMVGALLMHVKVKDPLSKSIPAFLMLIMSVSLIFISVTTKV